MSCTIRYALWLSTPWHHSFPATEDGGRVSLLASAPLVGEAGDMRACLALTGGGPTVLLCGEHDKAWLALTEYLANT